MQNVKLIRNLAYFTIHGNGTYVYMTVETNMIIYCKRNTEKGYPNSGLLYTLNKFDSQYFVYQF